MLKALLIAVAALVTFDAVAWHSQYRVAVVGELLFAASEIEALDWSWT